MAGFEKVDSLIRQFRFNSVEKQALGALQVVSKSQLVVDKWAGNKYKGVFKIQVVLFKNKTLTLGVENGMYAVLVRKDIKGLQTQINRILGVGLIKEIRVRVI